MMATYLGFGFATNLSGTTVATGRIVGANGSGAGTGLVAIRFNLPCVTGNELILVVGTAKGGRTRSCISMYSRNVSPSMTFLISGPMLGQTGLYQRQAVHQDTEQED